MSMWILQARILDWVAISFPRDLLQARDQTSIPCFGGQILYQLSHKGSPRILEWVAYSFSRESSRPRNQTGVSCIAGGFFTNWPQGNSKNTGVGSLSLLQQIFLTQESNQGILCCWRIHYQLSYQGSLSNHRNLFSEF